MPNGDPRHGFFYPTRTLMIDSYLIDFWMKTMGIGINLHLLKDSAATSVSFKICFSKR